MTEKSWFELMMEDFVTHPAEPSPCPPDSELLGYIQARLDGRALDPKLQAIARHAARCPACRRETEAVIAALSAQDAPALPRPIKPLAAEFLAQLASPGNEPAALHDLWVNKVADRFEALLVRWRAEAAEVGRALRQMGDRLVLSVPPLAPIPAMATVGVRGSALIYRYEIPELAAVITLTPARGERGWLITGELEPDAAERAGLAGVTLRLTPAAGPGESAHQSAQTDELGCFAFEDLEAGSYEVEIPVGEAGSIVLAEIDVG